VKEKKQNFFPRKNIFEFKNLKNLIDCIVKTFIKQHGNCPMDCRAIDDVGASGGIGQNPDSRF
jgi:hypothetical protein